MFYNEFIYLLDEYVLNTYYMLDTVLGTWNIHINEQNKGCMLLYVKLHTKHEKKLIVQSMLDSLYRKYSSFLLLELFLKFSI